LLIDCGAEINTVDEKFALEQGLREVNGATLPNIQMPDSTRVLCLHAYQATIKAQDSWGVETQFSVTLYSIRDASQPIILGLPGLKQGRVIVDCETKQWRYKLESSTMRVERPDQFIKSLTGEPQVYAVLVGSISTASDGSSVLVLPPELAGYEDVADNNAADTLPEHHGSDHAIEIEEGATVPYGPLYNLSPKELEVLREYLAEAKRLGWIRDSTSPAGAPILFVPKKDGTLRLCVDYRGLNKVTKKNRLALPLISETLDRLGGAVVFTKLDIKNAYHRIRIKRGDEWKTAFRTRYGHFEYMVMPFGLTNAPATFQGYINRALSGYLDIFCVVYLDDVLVFSQLGEDHWDHVRKVMDRLRQYSLYINLKKCAFATESVEFLGFIVRTDGVTMDPSRVDTILEWPTPTTFKDVQIFLGFANFYRRFIKGYSKIVGPITDLLKGSVQGKKAGPFSWPEAAEKAKRTLCDAFATAPVLRHYQPELPSRLETDASIQGIAGIFSQLQDNGNWHPVAFWSRKLIPAEKNYHTYDLELLAIVATMTHWRHYVEGLKIKLEVLTDHNNLRGFMGAQTLSRRQAGWAVKLAAYDFDIKHRAGRTNPADGPSRRPAGTGETPSVQATDMLPALQQKLQLGEGQIARPDAEPMLEGSQTTAPQGAGTPHLNEDDLIRIQQDVGEPTVDSHWDLKTFTSISAIVASRQVTRSKAQEAAQGQSVYSDPSVPLAILIREAQGRDPWAVRMRERCASQEGGHRDARVTKSWSVDQAGGLRFKNRVYVPLEPALRAELLKTYHDDPLAGHFGRAKTLELLARSYHWLNIEQDVKEYIDSCIVCQGAKSLKQRPAGELQALPRPQGPWQELTMDFITGLPLSRRNGVVYDAILVVVDRYTKMARYIPTQKTATSTDLADLFIHEIVRFFGLPSGIVSDRGSVFTSQFWSDFCFIAKTKRRLSTAFHPQTDGQTERQNQTLEQYLRSYVSSKQDDWTSLLPLAEFAYNNSCHPALKLSPFFACYGFHPRLTCEPTEKAQVPNAGERISELVDARKRLEANWVQATEYQQTYYNKHHRPQAFNIGDKVLLSTKYLRLRNPSRKLTPRFIGPFTIEEPIGTQAYKLTLPTNLPVHPVFHTSLLRPYKHRTGEPTPLPGPVELDDGDETASRYEVETLIGKRRRNRQIQYLVKWKGWPSEYNEWVQDKNIDESLVKQFKK
jgi:transposase InsO family protein